MAEANALTRFDLGAQPRIVQLRRSATGSSNRGVITRKAASLFIGAGTGAALAFSVATPPFMKSLRQRRTVSSRTPNASDIRRLVQPASVSPAIDRPRSPRSGAGIKNAPLPIRQIAQTKTALHQKGSLEIIRP